MIVKIVNQSNNPLPEYSTVHSAGMDLRANLAEPIVLKPLERVLVPTGLFYRIAGRLRSANQASQWFGL